MDDTRTFDLYKMFRNEMYAHLNLHREALHRYFAFSAGILAASIAGAIQLQGKGLFSIVVLIGPLLNIPLCIFSIRMCDRLYLSVLDRVAIIAKLEAQLKLHEPRSRPAAGAEVSIETVMPRDQYILPARWVEVSAQSTEDFVKRFLHKGINQIAHWTFRSLIGANVLVCLAAVYMAVR